MVSESLVQCFQKYFKIINTAQKTLYADQFRLKVIDFENLQGMESLRNLAIYSRDDKARGLSQELYVNLHLKFDNQNTTKEQRQTVI